MIFGWKLFSDLEELHRLTRELREKEAEARRFDRTEGGRLLLPRLTTANSNKHNLRN